ncbi:hypothetical protein D8Z77_22395 [Brevibacillus laterosporus]|nr:hypothetical protein D8Z77_22395 [Brevibacillus laterosporus]
MSREIDAKVAGERYENSRRLKYGKVQGHYRWDLAKTWFRTSNDNFFELYGFNFVPRGMLYEEAREFVWRSGLA